jgi:hypothetical protein
MSTEALPLTDEDLVTLRALADGPDDTLFAQSEVRRLLATLDSQDRKRRNKRNRLNGGAFERRTAKLYGGRRTGPLLGRDDVVTDSMFAIQTKRARRFGLPEARQYLADLRGALPTLTPIVVHALPGERFGVVIIGEKDWLDLHGPTDGG